MVLIVRRVIIRPPLQCQVIIYIPRMLREYDVTPQEQGYECIYQRTCKFYLYGIWCNECTQRLDFDDIDPMDDEI